MSGVTNLPTDNVNTPMTFTQSDAIKMSNAFNRVVADIKEQGTSGLTNVTAGSQLGNDIRNAEALSYQMAENYYASDNVMNGSANRFVNGAYSALVNFDQSNQMGTANLKSLENLAKNVVLALSPNVGSPPPAASPIAGAPMGGTPGTGPAGGTPMGGAPGGMPTGGTAVGGMPGGAPTTSAAGYAAVKTDLQNEARATTSTEKAHFVSQAITDLIAAFGGGGAGPAAGPATAGGAPATAAGGAHAATAGSAPPGGMPAGSAAPAGTAAPATGSISTPVASGLLNATNLASGLVQQSSAPESVKSSLQNTLAALVASIAGSTKTGATGPGAASNPNLTALLSALKQAADLVPQSGLSETLGNQLEDGLAGLVGEIAKGAAPAAGGTAPAQGAPGTQQAAGSVLQSLESVMEDLLPYLSNTPANNQALDKLSQVLEQLANAAQQG